MEETGKHKDSALIREELHFAYLVPDDPRSRPLQKAFHALIKYKGVAMALVEYCRKRAKVGV